MGEGKRQRPGKGQKRQILGQLVNLALFTTESLGSVEQ